MHYYFFQCFLPYFRSYCVHLSFSTFFTFFFLPYSLIRQCGLIIFLVFLFSRHILGPTVCIFHFSHFQYFLPYPRSKSAHFSFPWVSVFSSYSRSYSEHFSFSTFFSISWIFQVIQCLCFILHIFQVSPHNPGPIVCNSHFQSFSVPLAIFQVIKCAFDIFQLFHFFHIPGPTVWISHGPCFSVFFAIFQVKECAFHILKLFQYFTR